MFPLWCSIIWPQKVHSVLIKLVFWLIFPNSPDLDSDSEGSQHSTQSVHSEKTLLEKLEIMTNQGLIQVVKVFLDWLRTNTDIILMCAQVRWQILSCFVYETLTFQDCISQTVIICVFSAEFSKPVEPTVCAAQPATRWQQDARGWWVTGWLHCTEISACLNGSQDLAFYFSCVLKD